MEKKEVETGKTRRSCLPATVALNPLEWFDHPQGRERGSLDPEHHWIKLALREWFSGAAERPAPEEIYEWIIAPQRSERERGWICSLLVSTSAHPPWLWNMVRKDALSTYDLAVVVTEGGCGHARLTNWLNQYSEEPRARSESDTLSKR